MAANFRRSGPIASKVPEAPVRASRARAFGPISESTAVMPLVSVATAISLSCVWRAIQSRSRGVCAEPVTTRKRSAASRVMVTSLS